MPPPRRAATIPSTSVIGSISSTAPRGRRSETRLQLADDRLALSGRKQLRQIIRERGEPGGDLALALLRLEQLIRDVERRQDRRLVRLHDGTLRQHLLERLVHVGRDLAGVLGRQVGPHRVLVAPDHHLHRVFLGAHWAPPATPAEPAAPGPPAARPPPLPPDSRACSSRNVSRERRSCTRRRAASTRCRNVLFSCSRSATRPRASRSGLAVPPAPPRAPLSFSSVSALSARVRQPVSSSATWRRIVSSWSSTCPSTLSPSYAKLVLQSREPPRQRHVHLRLAQRALGVAEGAMPRDAAMAGGDAGPTILVEHLKALEQRAHSALQHLGYPQGAHSLRQHQRDVQLNRWLYRERTIHHGPPARHRQADLEPEQRSGPNRGIPLEGTRMPHHLSPPLHRHPPRLPAARRFQMTAGGRRRARQLKGAPPVPAG